MGEVGKLKSRRALLAVIVPIVAACLVVALMVRPAASVGFTRGNGYWLASSGGSVFAFGDASLYPSADGRAASGIVAMAARPTGKGYWLAANDGSVYAFGDAPSLGEADKKSFKGKIVAIAGTPTGAGYWLAGEKGEVLAFGDAPDLGTAEKRSFTGTIADIASTPSGHGFLLLSSSGQILAFGDAVALGSADPKARSVALALTPTGDGYWILGDKGDILGFGAARVFGAGQNVNGPVVDIAATLSGNGYWLTGSDGTVTPFGDAVLYGGLGRPVLKGAPIVAIVRTPFVNHPPVAVADSASLDEDTSVDVNVLANDVDIDGDAMSATLVSGAAHGVVTQNADGTFHYQPAPDYNGSDSFTYRVSDPFGASSVGLVTLTIRPVNDAPVARDDAYATDEDAFVNGAVLANDTDVDGDRLSVEVQSGPAHGTLTMNSDGRFTYLPAADYNGADSFTYRATDGQLFSGSATATIAIAPVNDAPRPVADAYFVDEDAELDLDAPGVLGNDTDPDSPTFTAVLVTGPANGDLELAGDGSFAYRPNPDFNGTDSFTYTATDGEAVSGPATVTITVNPVNDPPAGIEHSYTTDEDAQLVVAAPGVLQGATDVDGDPLTAVLFTAPDRGTLELATDGSFTYLPDPNFNGTDTFSYRMSDGQALSDPILVTITVDPVYDPPIAVDDSYTATIGVTLNVGAPGVLANDVADSGGDLTAELVTGVTHGTLVLNPDGSFTYLTNLTAAGVDSFTYRASDGIAFGDPATVTITVSTSSSGGGTGGFGGFTTPTLSVPDNDRLRIGGGSVTVQPAHGSIVSEAGIQYYVPESGYRGSDTFVVGGQRYNVDVLSAMQGDF
jgi:Big-like domain-containing protein